MFPVSCAIKWQLMELILVHCNGLLKLHYSVSQILKKSLTINSAAKLKDQLHVFCGQWREGH